MTSAQPSWTHDTFPIFQISVIEYCANPLIEHIQLCQYPIFPFIRLYPNRQWVILDSTATFACVSYGFIKQLSTSYLKVGAARQWLTTCHACIKRNQRNISAIKSCQWGRVSRNVSISSAFGSSSLIGLASLLKRLNRFTCVRSLIPSSKLSIPTSPPLSILACQLDRNPEYRLTLRLI